jgi:sigma-E factor negative regulatory protein RseA
MNDPRAREPSAPSTRREWLSSLSDGECPPERVDDTCAHWKADAQARQDWHVYHLIGDVLRSDELASPVTRDAGFLRELRSRLDREPVPLAPAALPAAAPAQGARRWLASVAAVAGFAVVGATVYVLRPQLPEAGMGGWTQADAGLASIDSGVMRRAGHVPGSASGASLSLDGQLIRDARLDAYFEAHRGAVGPVSPAMPGGALRSVEILVPQR